MGQKRAPLGLNQGDMGKERKTNYMDNLMLALPSVLYE